MAKPPAGPPFPNTPGAWIACFRHRVQAQGRPISPEELGRRIGRSGATIRRWESNRFSPEEQDLPRLAEACHLTPLQFVFLNAACTRMRPMPAPHLPTFEEYIAEVLCTLPCPAMVHDSLFNIRAWNSYVDVLTPTLSDDLRQGVHPVTMLMQMNPENSLATMQRGLRVFWMYTAIHAHRPEYTILLNRLCREQNFRELWMDLAFRQDDAPVGPIAFPYPIETPGDPVERTGGRFHVHSLTITFPPTYYLCEYRPANQSAQEQLRHLKEHTAPRVFFNPTPHWLNDDRD